MKIIFKDNIVAYPFKANISKSLDLKNNTATLDLPFELFGVIDSQDSFIVLKEDNNILFRGYVTGYNFDYEKSNISFSVEGIDKLSLITNRLTTGSFNNNDEKSTAPLIIGRLISKVTNDLKGVQFSRVNIKFVGYPRTDGIQVTTTAQPQIQFTIEDMETNSPSWQQYVNLQSVHKFPKINYGVYAKPMYDTIKELLQENFIGNKKRYVFDIDIDDNILLYAQDTITSQFEVQAPFKIKRSQEGEVNFLTIYCGDDLNNTPIHTYAYKDFSGNPNIQESYRNWSDIARDLKPQYTNNTEFRNACISRARARAQEYFMSLTKGELTSEITLYDNIFNLGDVINLKFYNYTSFIGKVEKKIISFSMKNGYEYKYSFKEVV